MKMNKKGFTLMEMLIVIAIIAILIAIAIPTFTNALEKSRQRTDMANVRSLKSLVVASYMAQDGTFAENASGVQWCNLVKGGQSFQTGSAPTATTPAGCVALEAAWKTKAESPAAYSYTKGWPIAIAIDLSNNGLIVGSVPYIPGNAS